jgi:hypothetical protein
MALNARRRPLATVGARRIDQFSNIDPTNSEISHAPQAAPIRIVVAPTESGRKWRATVEGEVLCVAAAPLVTAARLLIARGFDPTCRVEMWHADSAAWALRGRIGPVAAVMLDGERKAEAPAKNGPPMRPKLPGHHPACGLHVGGRNA